MVLDPEQPGNTGRTWFAGQRRSGGVSRLDLSGTPVTDAGLKERNTSITMKLKFGEAIS